MQREVFGPVVSVTRFSDPDDAIRWANESPCWARLLGMDARHREGNGDGRAASIWLHLDQHHFMLANVMPHGGIKSSGYGKDLSVYALEDYSVVRHVMVKI